MSTQGQIYREIFETPAAIRQTIAQAGPQAEHAADLMRQRQPQRIFIIGNGTSYYSSLAASYTARQLAAAQDAQVLAMPSGDFRYFTPALDGSEVIIGISASGEFRDVLGTFERLKGRCLCLGITHVPGSTLTQLADFCLVSAGGPSQVPVMTKTYASTLTAAHLVLLAFYQASSSYYADLSAAADRCEIALQNAAQRLPDLIPQLTGYEHAFHFGAGPAYAASLETALKMKEMALLHAEASETWEMGSGPGTMVNEHFLAVALSTGDETDAHTAETARHVAEWGAAMIEIGPQSRLPTSTKPLIAHLPVAAPDYPCFASLSLVPPAALLAYQLARQRGATPDTPGWRKRYHAQGLHHILGSTSQGA